MLAIQRRLILAATMALFAFLGPLSLTSSTFVATEPLPSQLSDREFWQLMTEFSEGGGYFRSDNFVSNETAFQFVLKDLKQTRSGGVYLGVGPDQNFTYIVSLQPKLAVIFDIRRQNAMQHLMYKALIEMSADRAEFLSLLFSRKRPEKLSSQSRAEELFAAYDGTQPDRQMFLQTFQAIKSHLQDTHGFKLTTDDEASIQYIFNSFYYGGPDLTYNGVGGGFNRSRMPTYAEVMQLTDEEQVNRSYMGSEENFATLRDFQKKNLIVPVVADFAGPKGIRAVANYLKEHDAFVSVFYLSNVEQYLFQQNDDWSRFYRNVQTLPLDSSSTFIRSVFNGQAVMNQPATYGLRSASLLSSIPELLKSFSAGQVRNYSDVIDMSK